MAIDLQLPDEFMEKVNQKMKEGWTFMFCQVAGITGIPSPLPGQNNSKGYLFRVHSLDGESHYDLDSSFMAEVENKFFPPSEPKNADFELDIGLSSKGTQYFTLSYKDCNFDEIFKFLKGNYDVDFELHDNQIFYKAPKGA